MGIPGARATREGKRAREGRGRERNRDADVARGRAGRGRELRRGGGAGETRGDDGGGESRVGVVVARGEAADVRRGVDTAVVRGGVDVLSVWIRGLEARGDARRGGDGDRRVVEFVKRRVRFGDERRREETGIDRAIDGWKCARGARDRDRVSRRRRRGVVERVRGERESDVVARARRGGGARIRVPRTAVQVIV